MRDETWLRDAACASPQFTVEDWFPNPGKGEATAGNVLAIKACRGCPVITECRERHPNFDGLAEHVIVIWAGEVLDNKTRRKSPTRCGGCSRMVPVTTLDGRCLPCA